MIDRLFTKAADMIVAISFASLLLPFAVELVQRRADARTDKALHDRLSSPRPLY